MTVLRASGPPVPGVRRIAVLRANALGDFVFVLPALAALRAAYPGAELVLIGLDWHRSFLSGRPGSVDRVEVMPPTEGVWLPPGWPDDPEGRERFFARLAAQDFDVALQLHGGGRGSNPFVRRLGARVTAGTRTPDAVALDRWIPYVYYQNEVLRLLETVALVGATEAGLEPALEVTDGDRREADAALDGRDGPLAVVAPGATDLRRRWPAEKLAAVADRLSAAGALVVLTGDEGEAELTAAVAEAMRAPALDLAGRLTLGALTGLLSRCAVLVGNDSGPLHLASAVGAATVAVFWCGNLVNAGLPTRARHRPAVAWRLHCPVCGVDCTRGQCDHDASFVADVDVEEVAGPALELLAQAGGGPGGEPVR